MIEEKSKQTVRKRIARILLCAFFLFAIYAQEVYAAEPNNKAEQQEFKIGDVNLDNNIDVNDVTLILNCLSDFDELSELQQNLSDINKDKK